VEAKGGPNAPAQRDFPARYGAGIGFTLVASAEVSGVKFTVIVES
jgi:hypothetical protein